MLVFRIHVFCCFRMSHISVVDISQLPINWLTYSWILVEGSNESECLFLQCLLAGAVRWVSHWTEQYTTYLSKHLPGVVSPIISGSSITLDSRPWNDNNFIHLHHIHLSVHLALKKFSFICQYSLHGVLGW